MEIIVYDMGLTEEMREKVSLEINNIAFFSSLNINFNF